MEEPFSELIIENDKNNNKLNLNKLILPEDSDKDSEDYSILI